MKQSKYTVIIRKQEVHLTNFTEYLKSKKYAKDTIRAFCNYAALYLDWLENEQIRETEVTYGELLIYIDKITTGGDSKGLINRKLAAIRKYYDFLQTVGTSKKNPAAGLFIKNKHQSVPSNLLKPEELSDLYENYQVTDYRTQRNKVILGLLVFQGVTREEIEKLEVSHLKLLTGKIEIPGGKHRNSRTLQLEASQMFGMQEYLELTRNEILKGGGDYGTGRKPKTINGDKASRQLFISMHASDNMKNTFLHLVYALRKLNPKVTTAQKLRQSVITFWLKTRNLRTVQYMAGHKYVSSTERYQENNLEELQQQVEKLHPLNLL